MCNWLHIIVAHNVHWYSVAHYVQPIMLHIICCYAHNVLLRLYCTVLHIMCSSCIYILYYVCKAAHYSL